MSYDPEEDFERHVLFDAEHRLSDGETFAQAVVVIVLGVPLLACVEAVRVARRVRGWLRQEPSPARGMAGRSPIVAREDIERLMSAARNGERRTG